MVFTSNSEILQARTELAEKYLEDIKKDLNVLEKGVISLMESKIKNLLLDENAMPDDIKDMKLNFIEKILVKIAPKRFLEKIYNDIKEKQKSILEAKTIEELHNLKTGILFTAATNQKNSVMNPIEGTTIVNGGDNNEEKKNITDSNPSNSKNESSIQDNKTDLGKNGGKKEAYKELGVLGAGALLEGGQGIYNDGLKRANIEGVNAGKAEKLASELNVPNLKKWLDDTKTTLEGRMQDPQLLGKQKREIKKIYNIFNDASKNADALPELKTWKSLVKSNVLSSNIFEICNLNEAATTELIKLSQDSKLIKEISTTTDIQKLKTLLAKNNIVSLSDETLKVLQNANTTDQVESIVKILSKNKELTSLAKAARVAPILDVITYGLQVGQFWGAEKNARNISHFAVNTIIYGGTAARGVAAMTGLVSAGPPGWIVLGGVVVAEGLNYGMDACYFDIKDFYNQKKQDFIKQSRTELKQAIVQATVGAEGSSLSDISINEAVYNVLPGGPGKEEKIKTVENAMWGLLYTEEVLKYPTVGSVDNDNSYSKLSADQKIEYDQQKKSLDEIIEKRMQYVRKFMSGGDQSLAFSNAIKQSKSIEFVQKIIADSEIYLHMIDDGKTSQKTIEGYKQERRKALEVSNPTLCKQIDSFLKKHPDQTGEFFANIIACSNEKWQITDANDPDYADDVIMKPIVDFATEYMNWYYLGTSFENKPNLSTEAFDIDFVKMHTLLKDMATGKDVILSTAVHNEYDMKRKLVHEFDKKERFNDVLEVSTDIRQNILYRIAKEFHGYTGGNNMTQLKQYFAEGNKDKKKGLYYEEGGLDNNDGRRMNLDRGVDARLNFLKLETQTPEQLMLQWFDIYVSKDGKQFMLNNNVGIDGETESSDDQVNQEFFAKIYTILKEEKESHSEKNKTEALTEVKEYIKNNAVSGYVKLPYYLVMKIAKAGLGNALYRYFTMKEGKIFAVTTNEYFTIPMSIPGVEKQYVENTDGDDKNLTEEQIKTLSVKSITGSEQKAVAAIDVVTDKIQKTVGALTWADQRGDIVYDPMKKVLRSWENKETPIEEKNGKRVVAKGDIAIEYISLEEAIYVANVINWMKKYKTENPNLELVYYGTTNWLRPAGLYNINTGFRNTDTRLISQKEIDNKFKETFTGSNYKTFIDYIEKKLV